MQILITADESAADVVQRLLASVPTSARLELHRAAPPATVRRQGRLLTPDGDEVDILPTIRRSGSGV